MDDSGSCDLGRGCIELRLTLGSDPVSFPDPVDQNESVSRVDLYHGSHERVDGNDRLRERSCPVALLGSHGMVGTLQSRIDLRSYEGTTTMGGGG